MKEPFLSRVVADEAKPSVTNESLDRTARHPSLPQAHLPSCGLSTSNRARRPGISGFLRRAGGRSSSADNAQTEAGYFETLMVMVEQNPGNVLCRSSPICSESLCFPG